MKNHEHRNHPRRLIMTRRVLSLLAAMMLAATAHAQDQSGILRFNPEGAGQWEQGKGTTKTFYYYRSKADPRVAAGVWSSNEPGGSVRKATFTEFIHIL